LFNLGTGSTREKESESKTETGSQEGNKAGKKMFEE
jgi:hypothetical protein